MPMPLTSGHPNPDRLCRKKSIHQRNGSGELDVFEAAKYFSGYNEAYGEVPGCKNNYTTYTQKIMKDEKPSWRGGRRISLDMGSIGNPILHHTNHHHHQQQQPVDKEILKEIKKHKQPSSPGGRLASFLNSLFNQTSSKKKKTKSSTQSIRDEDENSPGGGRRRRRSSISHFRSSSTNNNAIYSSSSSGFRTPPPYNANTPTKGSYKSNNLSDLKQVGSLSKHYMIKPTTGSQDQAMDEKRKTGELLDNIFSFKIDGYKGKGDKLLSSSNIINGGSKKLMEKKDLILFDDGAESDSSSDLFELQNCDLGIYSSGLPVYETTSMDNIKRSAPISSGAS